MLQGSAKGSKGEQDEDEEEDDDDDDDQEEECDEESSQEEVNEPPKKRGLGSVLTSLDMVGSSTDNGMIAFVLY